LIADYQIKYEPDGLEAALDIDCPDHRTIENAVLCKRRFTYSYRVPFTATVSLEHTLTGARSTSVLAVQPESESICQIFYHVSFNRAASCGADHDKIQKFEQQIMAEDLVVQEAYRDKRLLLRGGSEESIVADRITLAFRKSLLRSLIRLAAADAQ
jgi:hypothetical protein